MTEAEWLAATDPTPMLAFLRGKVSDRKLRMFGVACCRRIWYLMIDEPCQIAVETVEAFADELTSGNELASANVKVHAVVNDRSHYDSDVDTHLYAAAVARDVSEVNPERLVEMTIDTARQAAYAPAKSQAMGRLHTYSNERTVQRYLLRHIIGNPFQPYAAPASWPSTIVHLAQALYNGTDCRLPLSDALEEAGHAELAQHFRAEEWHPKGCFALDIILGKD